MKFRRSTHRLVSSRSGHNVSWMQFVVSSSFTIANKVWSLSDLRTSRPSGRRWALGNLWDGDYNLISSLYFCEYRPFNWSTLGNWGVQHSLGSIRRDGILVSEPVLSPPHFQRSSPLHNHRRKNAVLEIQLLHRFPLLTMKLSTLAVVLVCMTAAHSTATPGEKPRDLPVSPSTTS